MSRHAGMGFLPFPGPTIAAAVMGLIAAVTMVPAQAADSVNLLRNPRFVRASPWRQTVKTALEERGIACGSEAFPDSWSVTSHGKDLRNAGVDYHPPAETAANEPGRVRVINHDDEHHLTFFSPVMIPRQNLPADSHLGVTLNARGNGSITIGVFEYSAEYRTKGSGAFCGSSTWQTLSPAPAWSLLRTLPLRYVPGDEVGAVCLRFDIRGEVEIADVFFGAVPPIDHTAQSVFHLPFEGSLLAAYAQGNTEPYENAHANAYVEGLVGLAGRFGRTPGPHPDLGWYQFAIGPTYFSEHNIPRREGTIEVWFRPHPEMLTNTAWTDYYLWAVNRTSGPAIHLKPETDGRLTLTFSETVLTLTYPDGERSADKKTVSCELAADEAFFAAWHHLAFVYDANTRRVFLDGNPVLDMPAPKAVCMTGNDLSVGWAGRWGPWTACADLDEFRVYDRIRYLDAFTPEATNAPALPAPVPPAVDRGRGSPVPPLALAGPPRVEGQRLLLPLAAGEDSLELEIEIGDGLPFIVSSRGIKLGLKDLVESDPPIEALIWSAPRVLGPYQVGARLERYGLELVCGFEPQGDCIRLTLTLEHQGERWRAPLEVRVALREAGGSRWTHVFEGSSNRAITNPFLPLTAEGLGNVFPLAAAWGNGLPVAVAVAPESLVSYLRQGMEQAGELQCAWRTVLDPGQSGAIGVDVFTFDPRYGSDDAVARYQRRYPAVFRPDPSVDPRLHMGSANSIMATTFWAPRTHKEEKIARFSAQELCRRANAGWEWYYGTGTTAGNWSIDPFMLQALPAYQGKFGAGGDPEAQKRSRLNKFNSMDQRGIATGFYILTWIEQRYARYFQDAVISPLDTDDGVHYLDNWWTRGMRDYIVMPSWSRAGNLLRRQIDDILRENPPVAAFCYDVAERDHRDRAERQQAGAARAFDERGVYTAHLAAMAQLCDDIRQQRTAGNRSPGIIGNAHAWSSAFPVLFRLDSIILEGRPFEYVANDYLLRHTARFLGSKPLCMYHSGSSDLMGNYYPDVERLDPAAVRLDIVAVRMQCFLRGFLNNTWSTPGMTFGVEEIAAGQKDLARTLRAGFQFVAAASVPAPLQVARYGEAHQGVFAVVNPTLKPIHAALTMDADYLGVVPLAARRNSGAMHSGGDTRVLQSEPLALRGLDYALVDCVAALEGVPQGTALDLDVSLQADAGRRTVRASVRGRCPQPVSLRLGLEPHHHLEHLLVNDRPLQPLPAAANGSVLLPDITLDGVFVIEYTSADARWLSPAAEVIAFPILDQGGSTAALVCEQPEALHEARRLAEYVRFWSRNTEGIEPVSMKPQDTPEPNRPNISLALQPPTERSESIGIWLNGHSLHIWAPDPESLRVLLNDLFAALDERYPYVGLFGNQALISNYEDCSTTEQRRLLRHAGLPGQRVSLQDLLRQAP